jgi:hypothetical protein
MPCSRARRAAASAAVWAAKGRAFAGALRSALAPAELQLITSPAVSVMETMVLLKVSLDVRHTIGHIALAFLGPDFLAGLAMRRNPADSRR